MSNRRNLVFACFLVAGAGLAYISYQFRFDEKQGAAGNQPVTAKLPDGAVRLSQNVLTGSDLIDPLQPTSPNAQIVSLLQPIEDFRRWVEAGDRTDSATGLSLARTRRLALKQLIALDPQEALAHRLPAGQRARLDPQIASQLEEVVDQFSTYEVIAICGKEVAATDRFVSFGGRRFVSYTYGQRLRSPSQPRIPTHGIAIDDQLALFDAPYRVPDAGEALPLAAVDGVQVYVGDALQEFPSLEELRAWERIEIASEQQLGNVHE